MEVRGDQFQLVYEFGRQKTKSLPPSSRGRALINHVKLWVCHRQRLDFAKTKAEWIMEHGEHVGVRIHV